MDKSGTAENERFFALIKFILTYSAGGFIFWIDSDRAIFKPARAEVKGRNVARKGTHACVRKSK
jgi:hypothetical protein